MALGEGPGEKERRMLLLWFEVLLCVNAAFESPVPLPQANADPSVINCLHNLSRRIATVLQHEERRCQYLTREAKLILALQDEVSAVADGECGSISGQDRDPVLQMWKLRHSAVP